MTAVACVEVNGVELDPDEIEYSITVSHGRSDISTNPGPSDAEVTIIGETGITFEAGQPLRVGAYGTCRFTGTITDLRVTHLGNGRPRTTVTAIGRLGLLGYRLTDPATYAKETVRARVTRILDDSGLEYLNGGTTALTVIKPPEDDVPVTVESGLASLAEWSGATYFDTPNGLIVFESYGVRGSTANPGNWGAQVTTWANTERTWDSFPSSLAAFALPPSAVAYSPEFRKTSTSIINDVAVTHGDPPHVDTAEDADSIALYGRRSLELTTELDSHTDAETRASQILLAQARPYWNLGQITLGVHLLDTTDRDTALVLISGSLVNVSDLPTASPYTTFTGIVEGWRETYTPGQHWLTLSLSDPRFSYQTVTWEDVPPALVWDDVNPAVAWYNVVNADDLIGA